MIREKTIFRNFLFGAVLLAGTALAVSCSVDEAYSVSDTNAISFKSVVATRATATTVNNFEAFRVWGYTQSGTFMNGVIAQNDGTGNFTTTPTYYWPGCSVDFYAISPVGENGTDGSAVISTASGTEIATYDPEARTIDISVPEDASDQIDLIYAVTADRESGTVNLNFRHALAQVEFKALNTNSWMTVEVAGVKVASVANHGELALPTESTAATDGAYGTWTPAPVYNLTAYAAGVASSAVTLGSEATALTADGGALFLIPQETAAWEPVLDKTNDAAGAYFLISCRISQFGVQLWPDPTGTETFAEVAIPCKIEWEQGKKYTYTFSFGEGAGYYPPTDPSKPGTAVLDGPIEFTVDVTEPETGDVEVEGDTVN